MRVVVLQRCEEDVEYETIIKQIFQIVATFTDDEIAKGGHGGPASPSNVDSPITPPGNLSPQPSITLAGPWISSPSKSQNIVQAALRWKKCSLLQSVCTGVSRR